MIRFLALAGALAAAPLFAAPLSAASLADIQSAFRQTTTMHATFVQTGADGRESRGQMLLKRPGKVRFDYGKGTRHLVVADGRTLSFVDYEVAQVSQWPLRRTPLGVLLDPAADLSARARVLPPDRSPIPGLVAVEAQDPKQPDQGRIMFFVARDSAAPGGLRLAGWRVTDAQGNLTSVRLEQVRFNEAIADSRFGFTDPRAGRARPGRPG
jgi:outer membrane lipoprotein-sorting protein